MTDCMCRGCHAGSGASMHYIPKDPEIRQKWIDFIYKNRPTPKRKNVDRIRICSVHFTEESFTNYRQKMMGFGKRLILKPTAVPTITVETPHPITSSSRTRREKVEVVGAEMRLCPLCQRRQKDKQTLSIHLIKKHSVHPACLENLVINSPYVNRSSSISVSSSQNINDTSQAKSSENNKSFLIAVQPDQSSQETCDKSGLKNSESGFGNPNTSVQEDKSINENTVAPDSSVNHPFKCHACLDFFTHKSTLSTHRPATHIQKTLTVTEDNSNSSTHVLAYPYVATKPYQCDVCQVSYFYSFGLESHLKSVLHQSRTRKAENAAANNLAGAPLTNATRLATAKTQAEKVQLQSASSLGPAPMVMAQAVSTVLPVLTLAPNSVPHAIVPSVIPPSGTTTQLIPRTRMLMPLIINGLQTHSATSDDSQQILQQSVPVLGLSSAQQVKGFDSGDSQSQSAATGVSGASQVHLLTDTTLDKVGVKVKIEIKEEPCDQEVSQMLFPSEYPTVGIKQEQDRAWDEIEESVPCDDKVSLRIHSKRHLNANQASTSQDSRLSTNPLKLTEFQSQVLWAFIESCDQGDCKIPPREDCEALSKVVGLNEDEVERWLTDIYCTKNRHQADIQSLHERQEITEDDEDTLMIDKSGGTVLHSMTDFLSDEEEEPDEETTMDKKRKWSVD